MSNNSADTQNAGVIGSTATPSRQIQLGLKLVSLKVEVRKRGQGYKFSGFASQFDVWSKVVAIQKKPVV